MKDYFREKWHIMLYFICIGIAFFLVCFHDNQNHDEKFVEYDTVPFAENWQYDFLEGTSGITDLPADLPQNSSHTLVLKNTLPEVDHTVSLFFQVRHVAVKIYVDGELCVDTISCRDDNSLWEDMIGLYYQEISITPEDSGKEIVIESFSNHKRYIASPGEVYLGDRGSLFLNIFHEKWKTLLCTILLIFLAGALFLLWFMSTFLLKRFSKEMLCLALFSTAVACWLFTESNFGQFLFHDTGKVIVLAYELLMLMPVPIALFFSYYSEREKVKTASKIVATIPLGVFLVNNLLHLFRIVYLPDTLIITQTMIAFELAAVAIIQVTEIIYKSKKKEDYNTIVWKIPLYGIAALVPLATMELLKYAFASTKYPNDGIMISFGVLFYMISLAFDSIVRLYVRAMKYKQSAEVKTQFLANMSHEIRTPLNAILSFNEVILRTTKEEAVKKYAGNIQEAGENLKGIINSILDISKIESGKLEIYSVEYSTIQLLDHVVSMIDALARKKGLTLITDIDSNLPEVLIGDENHILQIITNIMTNAVKYTDVGSVTFTVKVLEMPENMPLCRLYISVKDTGIGIKPEDKERLFQKFERLDGDKNYSKEGTGLGMSIVLQLLRAMGSKIEVDSVYGQGSDFHFELVQSVVNRKEIGSFLERRKELALQNSHGLDFIAPKAKILIVDDVQMNLDAACALLEQLQMEIHTAQSAKEAIRKVTENHYDLVLMDHMMPEMDGIVATEKIRDLASETQDPYYAQLPIIALTANAMVGMKESFLQAGMQDFISKPIEINALNATIKKWLPKELVQGVSSQQLQQLAGSMQENKEDSWAQVPVCVDVATARQFSNTYQLFEKNIKSYSGNYAATRDKLRQFKEQKDVENYTITVHGLKSTSKMIGLIQVSELARDQEEKCQTGQEALVWEETEYLLAKYEACVTNLQAFLNEHSQKDKKETEENCLSEEEYQALIQRIKEAADSFDMGEFLILEEEFEQITVPKEKEEEFSKIREMVSNTSFGDLSEYLA